VRAGQVGESLPVCSRRIFLPAKRLAFIPMGATMFATGETMSGKLQDVMRESHVGAITIAVLLFLACDALQMAVRFLWAMFFPLVYPLLVSHFQLNVPLSALSASGIAVFAFSNVLSAFLSAGAGVLAAWLVARWVYGTGILEALADERARLKGKTHA